MRPEAGGGGNDVARRRYPGGRGIGRWWGYPGDAGVGMRDAAARISEIRDHDVRGTAGSPSLVCDAEGICRNSYPQQTVAADRTGDPWP
jgi:hypothetical protein